eukprot:1157831-Pelagomonas_calceolata.AAC.3
MAHDIGEQVGNLQEEQAAHCLVIPRKIAGVLQYTEGIDAKSRRHGMQTKVRPFTKDAWKA